MSVYTPLSHDQIARFVVPYKHGSLSSFCGISSGVENTNYFVTLMNSEGEEQEYVLTLFESLDKEQLPFFIDLTTFLNQQNCPIPCPLQDQLGEQLKELAGKPAVIVPKAAGVHCERPSNDQCAQIGTVLAGIHLTAQNFQPQPTNSRSLVWMQQTAKSLEPLLAENELSLLLRALREIARFSPKQGRLPAGIIHGDLFRDNALFDAHGLTAIIDFYNACHDDWLYDVAICMNDWCSETDGKLNQQRVRFFLQSYHAARPFSEDEKACWKVYLLKAACRFWLSRLRDWYHPNKLIRKEEHPHPVTVKDPKEFQRTVEDRLKLLVQTENVSHDVYFPL